MKTGTKSAVVVSGVILAIGLVGFYLFYARTLDMLKYQIKERLELRAFNTVDRFDRIFYERYLDMKKLATDPIISSRSSTPEQITGRLLEWQNQYRYYASVTFFDKHRTKRAGTSSIGMGEQHPLTEYMKDIAEGKHFIIGISESRVVKDVAFYFASLVEDRKGNSLGVVSARMPVEAFHEIAKQAVGSSKETENMKMDLVDKDGFILYSNYNMKGMLKETLPGWDSVKQSMAATSKTDGGVSYQPGIEKEVHIIAPEPGYLDFVGNGWILILHVPEKEAFGPPVETRILFLFIGAFILAGALLVHLIVQRR